MGAPALAAVFLVLGVAAVYRLLGRIDARERFGVVTERLGKFRRALEQQRRTHENTSDQHERGKIFDAKESTRDRYLERIDEAGRAIGSIETELTEYMRAELLLGLSGAFAARASSSPRESRWTR